MADPCCIPSNRHWAELKATAACSAERPRATRGSTMGLVHLEGGRFLIGSEGPEALAADGEGPVRAVHVDPFYLSSCAVTQDEFAEFIQHAGYVTEAERTGWSYVFASHLRPAKRRNVVKATPWWVKTERASWRRPFGEDPGRNSSHPVVHVSWNDAKAYCGWAGYRLPTEAEWEFASRGGLEQKLYPWGDDLTPEEQHHCNIWQGEFPARDRGDDGFTGTAPVDSFPSNAFGLHNMTGNVWEWCEDYFDPNGRSFITPVNPTGPPTGTARVMKGGSYLCHRSYCFRYRNSARSGNTPDSFTGNLGFRVARDV